MIKTLKLTVLFGFLLFSVTAQDISRRQADSLISALNQSIADTDRVNALLQLAKYNTHIRKASDSILKMAETYMSEAEKLNQRLQLPLFSERLVLIRSDLDRARGNIDGGKALLNQLIVKLQSKGRENLSGARESLSGERKTLSGGGDMALLANAYYQLSEYYSGNFLHETMMERIRYLKLAIEAFKETDHLVELARCYRLLADLHQLVNDNTSAFNEVRMALKYYDQAGYADKQGAVSLLGRIYYEDGDYKQSLNYELMALKIATNSEQDNVRLLCQINNNIGYTYLKLNENQKALQYFQHAFAIAEQEKDNATIYLLAANVVDAYLMLHMPDSAAEFFKDITGRIVRPAELKYEGGDYGISQTYLKIYLALKQYDQAARYCNELIRQAANPNINLYTLSLYYQLVARYYIETAKYENAQSYLKKDQRVVDSLKNFSEMAQNYKLWFLLDTASGKYREAIANLVKANELKDSMFDETKSRQIAQLEVEYETEKKEDQITLLNQKEILENTQLKQSNFVKNVTIGGIIMLLIIAGLLYRQSSFRKKTNIVVTHKNQLLQNLLKEKEWLLKEVHHRVKNNLHTVVCLLESQARYLEEDALRAIESSQHRIYAMSLLHQKLYQSDNMGTVDAGSYLKELASYLSGSFGDPGYISIELRVEEIRLNLSQAIPLGLIINEAITNAFKYAFPDKRAGRITIGLEQRSMDIRAIIADNGIGMNPDRSVPSSSLGLDLIQGLAMDLQGQVLFENDHGTRITVLFPKENSSASDTELYTVANTPI